METHKLHNLLIKGFEELRSIAGSHTFVSYARDRNSESIHRWETRFRVTIQDLKQNTRLPYRHEELSHIEKMMKKLIQIKNTDQVPKQHTR